MCQYLSACWSQSPVCRVPARARLFRIYCSQRSRVAYMLQKSESGRTEELKESSLSTKSFWSINLQLVERRDRIRLLIRRHLTTFAAYSPKLQRLECSVSFQGGLASTSPEDAAKLAKEMALERSRCISLRTC